MIPVGCASSSGTDVATLPTVRTSLPCLSTDSLVVSGCSDAFNARSDADTPTVGLAMLLVTETAIKPGKMTRNGKNILGIAAINGTRRAETSESAAIARWMTRKSVHQ